MTSLSESEIRCIGDFREITPEDRELSYTSAFAIIEHYFIGSTLQGKGIDIEEDMRSFREASSHRVAEEYLKKLSRMLDLNSVQEANRLRKKNPFITVPAIFGNALNTLEEMGIQLILVMPLINEHSEIIDPPSWPILAYDKDKQMHHIDIRRQRLFTVEGVDGLFDTPENTFRNFEYHLNRRTRTASLDLRGYRRFQTLPLAS